MFTVLEIYLLSTNSISPLIIFEGKPVLMGFGLSIRYLLQKIESAYSYEVI